MFPGVSFDPNVPGTYDLHDWAGEVQDPWFISDGIHFTSRGYAERARRIAEVVHDLEAVKDVSDLGALLGTE